MDFYTYNTNIDNINFLSKEKIICINFSKTRYLNFFIGHGATDKIYDTFYKKLIKKYPKHYLEKFDRIFLCVEKENTKKIINEIIKDFSEIISEFKEKIKEEAKKDGIPSFNGPYIQILVTQTKFNLEEFEAKKTLIEMFDRTLYNINIFNNTSYFFDITNFESGKINV